MLSIIIPAYNERFTIGAVLAQVSRALPGVRKEIVVVDDGSRDGTREWLLANFPEDRRAGGKIEIDGDGNVAWSAAEQADNLVVRIKFHEKNSGKGAAIQTGLAIATGDVFVIQDADLEYDPADWTEMYDLITVRKVADVVYGSRFYGRPHRSLYFHHYLGNRLISLLFNALYNQTLTDIEVCYKMFTREVRDSLRLTSNDFGIEVQISAQIALARNWRIYEIGIRYFGRTYHEGKKINWKDGFKALWYLLKYRCDGDTKQIDKSTRARVAISVCIFAVLLTVFAASPIKIPTDSRWSVHTAMSFARGHGGDLTAYLPIIEKEKFYAIERPDGRPRTRYPIGTSLLAVPAVVAIAAIDPGWAAGLPYGIPVHAEAFIASLIGAAAGVVFFWVIFSQFESLGIALISTVIFAFGTSIWSTATRALWQHGPLVLMLSIAMLLFVRARRRPELVQFISLPLMMGYVIRPTGIVPLAVLSLYVLIYHRQWVVKYFGWMLLIALPWLAYNFAIYGRPVPVYYVGEAFTAQTRFVEGLLGNLISPSRGLFVFSPVLLFALSGFALALRERSLRPVHLAYAAIIAGHCLIIGAASNWWAGHAFGPRFMTDIVPFLVYFTAFNFRLPDAVSRRRRTAVATAIVVLAVVSAGIHAQGAFRYATWEWNYIPDGIDRNTARAWDWSDPQFARTHSDH